MIVTLHLASGSGVVLSDKSAAQAYDELMICRAHPNPVSMTHLGERVVAYQIDDGALHTLPANEQGIQKC